MNKFLFATCLLFMFCVSSCNGIEHAPKAAGDSKKQVHLINDIPAINEEGTLNMVVEIPAGTIKKWEVEKEDGQFSIQMIDGKEREVNYLGYPGNYGFIPRTLLSKESGGDGDPLDVIALGKSVEKGSILKCRLIGVLKLLDRGEQDDKLIAVPLDSQFSDISDISELDSSFVGITEILKLWFDNYKGPGKMEFQGFGNQEEARKILNLAIQK